MIVYDQDDMIPSATVPLDFKFHCQQSNSFHQMTNSIDKQSITKKKPNNDEEIFFDVFQSADFGQTNDTRSMESQSFT